ncbi:MAG: DUF6261 family protein [Bacteroidales bacterium]|jgi:hypothetical protein|nr:DUF6261 family protein [Bacteroidales bacterium]
MNQFIALTFKSLPNAAHFNFVSQVKRQLDAATPSIVMALGDLPMQFNEWFGKEFTLMEWVRKSELTAQIAEADREMDHALVGLGVQVKAQEYSTAPNVAEAARRVGIMLKHYGYVYKKPYEQQEGDMRAIFAQFDGDYLPDVMLLGLTERLDELKAAFAEFERLLAMRDVHSLKKPSFTFPDVRRGIEDVYHRMVKLIDAGAALNMSPEFADFINGLNPEIERLNAEFHRTLYSIAAAEPAPIPQQSYTGFPITPLPEVFFVTQHDGTVKLELGRDYNLTYRNNVNVGNAECTMHGKGKYNGRKTVTFIIIRN